MKTLSHPLLLHCAPPTPIAKAMYNIVIDIKLAVKKESGWRSTMMVAWGMRCRAGENFAWQTGTRLVEARAEEICGDSWNLFDDLML
jgi:hypothetical protein